MSNDARPPAGASPSAPDQGRNLSPPGCDVLAGPLPAGIHAVRRDRGNGALQLEFDPDRTSEEELRRYADELDRRLRERFRTCAWRLEGHACESCSFRLEQRVEQLQGVRRARASFLAGRLSVEYDPARTDAQTLKRDVAGLGNLREADAGAAGRWEVALTVIAGLCLAVGLAAGRLQAPGWVVGAVWMLAYLSGGYFGLVSSVRSLHAGVVDVDLLMVLAALGAAYVGAPFEGGMLLFLFALSNVLQCHAIDRSRRAIQALMRLRPSEVTVQEDGRWIPRPVEAVEPGARVLIRPGGNIALDGTVAQGESAVDESSLTGEAIPVAKGPGDAVFAGTINQTGSLEYLVTKRAADSTLARVIAMVEDAQAQKAKTQRFLEKAEQHYALGVILFTLGLIALPPLLAGADFAANFYRAMTVMVVASPCALVISTPAAFLSAIGGAARRGVLFKGGVHLERLAEVEVVAFDKTGTLTRGKPRVTDIRTAENGPGDRAADLLRLAAAVEAHSEHPLAHAILTACRERNLDWPEAARFRAVPGKGATAQVEGRDILAGSLAYFDENRAELPPPLRTAADELQENGRTLVVIGEAGENGTVGRVLGLIGIADEVRPEAAEMVRVLKRGGVRRVAMLTGDQPRVAACIARETGMDDVFAGLLPEDKVMVVRRLGRIGPVAMVGDGVNDAPALAAAHVGIAMGAAGTDVAMETADVVLMSDNLRHLAHAFALSRQSRRIVTQNLVFALAVILVLVTAALTIGIPLPLGVVGHEGSTVLVCLNGLRLLGYRSDA